MIIDPGARIRRDVPEPHAGDLFTDRESESTAFANALAAHRRRLDADDTEPDGASASLSAHNALVYYGVGGVGKSTLSERLESWAAGDLPLLNGWGSKPPTPIDAVARIDLHGSGGQFDALGALLAIRTAVGGLKRFWPSFDLALTAYWTAARPHQPVPQHGAHRTGDVIAESVSNTLSDLGVLDTAIGLGIRGTKMVITEIRRRRTRSIALSSFDGYADLLERCISLPSEEDPHLELAGELATLLAYELSIWDDGSTPLVVVFVDAVEHVTSGNLRSGERLLNQIVWSMPNVIFVLTGRNILDWYETRTLLYSSGRSAWPGLVPGCLSEPRQHLVGKLSMEDRLRVIEKGRELFDLPISDEVARELAIASGGLPQYLDLAREVASSVKRAGGASVSVSDVTGSLGELVLRVLEDVPHDEQRAIRAAALFPFFDTALIATAAGVDHGSAERAVRRPMIDRREGELYPYRLHDEVRAAIRASDHRVAGGWAEADWAIAGTRALREARVRYETASESTDYTGQLTALGLAIGIVCELDVSIDRSDSPNYRDWLSQALVFGPSFSGLRPHIPATSRTAYGRAILDFVSAKSNDLSVDERCNLLLSVFDSDHPLAMPAGRHLAYTLRGNGRWDAALGVFDELISRKSSELHHYQRAMTLIIARRFLEADSATTSLPDGRVQGIRRSLAVTHGKFDDYFDSRPAQLEKIRADHRHREFLESWGNALRWQAFIHPTTTSLAEIEDLRERAESAAHDPAIRDSLFATIMLAPASSGDALELLQARDRGKNQGSLGYRSALATATVAYFADDQTSLAQLRDEVADREEPRSRSWVGLEFLLAHVDLALPPEATQWLEPVELVQRRWVGHFDAWASDRRHSS